MANHREVTIQWLTRKWNGMQETVARSRVKTTKELRPGMDVWVTYKSCRYRAVVVKLGPLQQGSKRKSDDTSAGHVKRLRASPPYSPTLTVGFEPQPSTPVPLVSPCIRVGWTAPTPPTPEDDPSSSEDGPQCQQTLGTWIPEVQQSTPVPLVSPCIRVGWTAPTPPTPEDNPSSSEDGSQCQQTIGTCIAEVQSTPLPLVSPCIQVGWPALSPPTPDKDTHPDSHPTPASPRDVPATPERHPCPESPRSDQLGPSECLPESPTPPSVDVPGAPDNHPTPDSPTMGPFDRSPVGSPSFRPFDDDIFDDHLDMTEGPKTCDISTDTTDLPETSHCRPNTTDRLDMTARLDETHDPLLDQLLTDHSPDSPLARLISHLKSENRRLLNDNQHLLDANRRLTDENVTLRTQLVATRPRTQRPNTTSIDSERVMIGVPGSSWVMAKSEYNEAFDKSSSAKELILKLMGKVLTREELARSNFYGGKVYNGKQMVTKESLSERISFQAIVAQAELVYPGGTSTQAFQRDIRIAVNSRCRRADYNLRHMKA
ncbi:uncharacterized protein LOC121422245 isoform X2 [Lytechinus variegatus]|uniref:uncharacterized protein LOC121422245 isoform X2 n=1 Tax=Lytechinus variegatus TaxID=7654 RepID=UPI001BB1D361|nr:uncharacterized protein LOC121422245 isoform X2 [Lytechinus variegatus]